MNTKSKKMIMIIALIIAISFIFIILYKKTDLFKTKEQLFWKYFLLEKDEIINVLSNDDIKKYSKSIKTSYYIKESNISVNSNNKLINPINISLSEKGNKKQDYKNIFIDLNYKNKNVGNATIIKDDNYFFIKNDLINSNYIGIENKNLKRIANNLGVSNVSFLPNKIKDIDYFELFYISDKELNRILKKYIPICRKYVNNKDYIVDKSDNVTNYELDVSEKQLNELAIAVLNNIYDDNDTLDFIFDKMKIIDEDNEYCDAENVKRKIVNIVEGLEHKEADDKKVLSIIIHKNEKSVEKVELIFEKNRTISIEKKNQNELLIKQYNIVDQNVNLKNIDGILRTIINCISEITYTKNVENGDSDVVDLNIKFNIGIDTITLNYNYVEQIKNNVDNILRKNNIEYTDWKKLIKNNQK